MSVNFVRAFDVPKKDTKGISTTASRIRDRARGYGLNNHRTGRYNYLFTPSLTGTHEHQRRGYRDTDAFLDANSIGRRNAITHSERNFSIRIEENLRAEKAYHNSLIYDNDPANNHDHVIATLPSSPSHSQDEGSVDRAEYRTVGSQAEWAKNYRDVLTNGHGGEESFLKGDLSLSQLPIRRVRFSMSVSEDMYYHHDPEIALGELLSGMIGEHKGMVEENITRVIDNYFNNQPEEFSFDTAHEFIANQQGHQDVRDFRYLRYDQEAVVNRNSPEMNPYVLAMGERSKSIFYNNYNNSFGLTNNPSGMFPECTFLGHNVLLPHFDRMESGGYMWNPKDINIIRTKRPEIKFVHDEMNGRYRIHFYDEFRLMILNPDSIKRVRMSADGERRILPVTMPETSDEHLVELLGQGANNAKPPSPSDMSENTAIETLREEITETEFRNYLKRGFLNVMGASGRTYQIFRKKQHIKVWYDGDVIEEICVGIQDYKVPPTDKLIAFKMMIETDEEEFKKLGNVYPMKKVA